MKKDMDLARRIRGDRNADMKSSYQYFPQTNATTQNYKSTQLQNSNSLYSQRSVNTERGIMSQASKGKHEYFNNTQPTNLTETRQQKNFY